MDWNKSGGKQVMSPINIALDKALEQYNKTRKSNVSVKESEDKTDKYMFFIDEKPIGHITAIPNYSNCGVLDLHGMLGNPDIILRFVALLCNCMDRSILTYNTSYRQEGIKRALEEHGFYTVDKLFLNKASKSQIQFHIKDLTQ